MVNAVNGKIIFRTLPKRDLSSLKGIIKLNSFAIGKNQLGPCITGLFQKSGYDVKEIHLDNVAKIRLLGMSPALEQRVEKGETIDKIFSDLDLSSFLTENQNLYVLGENKNIAELKKFTSQRAQDMIKTSLDKTFRESLSIVEEIRAIGVLDKDSGELNVLEVISSQINILPKLSLTDSEYLETFSAQIESNIILLIDLISKKSSLAPDLQGKIIHNLNKLQKIFEHDAFALKIKLGLK